MVSKKITIKTLLYRILSILLTFTIVIVLTGNLEISLVISIVDFILKTFFYFIYDKIWIKRLLNLPGTTLWLTGLCASGKTTIAKNLQKKLIQKGYKVILLDGDDVRETFGDLKFDKDGREAHIEKVARFAGLLQKQGLIVIVSLISPYRKSRELAKTFSKNFIEIFVDAPLEVCISRDPKNLYKKALKNEIKDFTGINSPYEKPLIPDIHLKTAELNIEDCVETILRKI